MILDSREQKRRLLLRLKGVESGRVLIGPSVVNVHLTDLCNLACQYCWYYGPGTPHQPTKKKHMPYELFEKLAADCADLQVDTIFLSGEGEPTLHPRFWDMLPHLEKTFTVNIYSNGTFPLARCRDILRADRIVINFGEADRESYRKLQGKDLFMRVIRNIRELAKLRAKYNPTFIIHVLFIMTRLNAEHYLKTETLVKKLGADMVEKRVLEVYEHSRHLMLPGQGVKNGTSGEWPPCYHGWFNSAISLNGDVNVCCALKRLTLGNIGTTSFTDIWRSDAYAQARVSALTGGDPFRNYQECMKCPLTKRNKEIDAQMDMYNRVQQA